MVNIWASTFGHRFSWRSFCFLFMNQKNIYNKLETCTKSVIVEVPQERKRTPPKGFSHMSVDRVKYAQVFGIEPSRQ